MCVFNERTFFKVKGQTTSHAPIAVTKNASCFTFTYPCLEIPMHNNKKNFILVANCVFNKLFLRVDKISSKIDDMSQN